MIRIRFFYILFFLLGIGLWACTEEKDFEGYPEETPGTGIPSDSVALTPSALFGFADTVRTVMKSEGRVEIPVVLSERVADTLYLKVKVIATDHCEEGREFTLEKECLVAKDSTEGVVVLHLNDDQKPGEEMSVTLELEGGAGAQKLACTGEQNRCRVSIVSHAIVFFEKIVYTTWEAANVRPEALEIPLKIAGELTGEAQVVLSVKEVGAEGEDTPETKHWELEDYTLTLSPGDKSGVIRMYTLDDEDINEDRIAEIRITEVSGGNLSAGRDNQVCRVTVRSEEIAKVVKFPELNYSVDENVAGGQLRISVIMDLRAEVPVVVGLSAIDGSAVAGNDYRLLTDEVTIPAGDTVAYAYVAITDDHQVTGNRDFQLQITSVAGGNASPSAINTCRIEIAEDDYEIGFAQATYEFAENATGKIIRLTSSKTLETPVTLTLDIESGATAVKGTHFNLPLEVMLPAGEAYIDVPVTLIPDPYVTGDKEFGLKIIRANDAGGILPETACAVTIKETDVRKTINFASTEYVVREDDGTADIVVRLDDRLPEDVTIAVSGYNTAYCSGPAAVTIPGGQTSATLTLNLTDDQSFNADREVTLSLGVITYGNMTAADVVLGAQNTCKVIIANDDLPEWNATVPAYTLEEASGEQQITVTLKQAYDADITVYLSPSGATFGTELAEITPVTIPAGQTSVNVTVNMMANPLKEPSIFALQVTKVNNSTYDTPVTVANITPTACLYRRLLGKWKLSSDRPEGMNLDCEIIISSGENGADFNKRLVCTTTGKLCTNSTATFKWYMDYDPSTHKIKVVMGERINIEDGFALNDRAIYMTWNYYGNTAVKYIETTLQDENTLLWNSGGSFVCIAYIAKDNNEWLSQGGWHLNNVKMKR